MSTSAPDHTHAPGVFNDAAMRELAMIRATLGALLAAERFETLQTIVGGFTRRESILQNSPNTSSKRLIIPREGTGQDGLQQAAVGSTPVTLLRQSEGRLGGLIVNYGAAACFLYLAREGDVANGVTRPNVPATWLAASGGAWDLRLGNIIYGGDIIAVCPSGSTSLTVAEF